MKRKMKGRAWPLRWLPALACMAAIFLFSAQPGPASAAQSMAVEQALHTALGVEGALGSLQFLLRKGAHFLVYTALGAACVYGAAATPGLRGRADLTGGAALAAAVAYAAGDELHQWFVPGRSGQLRDVLLDGCGAFTGVLLALLVWALWRRFHTARRRGRGGVGKGGSGR